MSSVVLISGSSTCICRLTAETMARAGHFLCHMFYGFFSNLPGKDQNSQSQLAEENRINGNA